MTEGTSIDEVSETTQTLTPDDQAWLNSFGVDPSWHTDSVRRGALQDDIVIGSKHLTEPANQAIYQQVVTARERFMEFVGIDPDALSEFRRSHPEIIPLDTFIQSQRAMHELGLNSKSIIERSPIVLSFSQNLIHEKFNTLTELGLDPVHIINSHPDKSLNYSSDSIREKVGAMKTLGLDPQAILKEEPDALLYPPETLQDKVSTLKRYGINAADVINSYPSILGLKEETVTEKIDNLKALGLSVAKVVNAYPPALGFGIETVQEKFANLQSLGLNPSKVMNSNPMTLGLSIDNVQGKLRHMSELGLDAVKVVNAFPGTLSLSRELVQKKLDNLRNLGINPAKAINDSPQVLAYAQESISDSMTNLTNLGLDAVKVANTIPAVLGYANESVRDKVANIASFGFDAVKLINNYPSILRMSRETIQEKVRLLERTIGVLNWNHTVKELVEFHPSILGFNVEKIKILRRIVVEYVSSESNNATLRDVQAGLTIPLEKFIIAIEQLNDNTNSETISLQELVRKARESKLKAPERQEKALSIAEQGNLGRIGKMYTSYRRIKPKISKEASSE